MLQKKHKIKMVIPIIILGFFLMLLFLSVNVSANTLDDIATGVNNGLFDGESLYKAKMVLSVAILVSASLSLAILRLPVMGMLIVMISVIGLLTAIGWLDRWIIIVTVILIAGLFAKAMANVLSSSGSESGG